MKLFLALSFALIHAMAQAGPQEEASELRREALKLDMDMQLRVPNITERDPELKELAKKSAAAISTMNEAIEFHPALGENRAKRDAAYAQLTVAMGKGTKGNDNDKRIAQEAYMEANTALSRQARELSDIKTLVDQASAAEAAFLKKKDEVYAALPETAELAKKVAELRAKASHLSEEAKQISAPERD